MIRKVVLQQILRNKRNNRTNLNNLLFSPANAVTARIVIRMTRRRTNNSNRPPKWKALIQKVTVTSVSCFRSDCFRLTISFLPLFYPYCISIMIDCLSQVILQNLLTSAISISFSVLPSSLFIWQ